MPDCCGGSSRDTALEAYHRKESKTRGCTDVVPLLAFLVNWGVLFYVVHLARTTGGEVFNPGDTNALASVFEQIDEMT